MCLQFYTMSVINNPLWGKRKNLLLVWWINNGYSYYWILMILKVFLLLTFNKHRDLHGSKFHRHLKHMDSATPGLAQWSPPVQTPMDRTLHPDLLPPAPGFPPGACPGQPSAWHPWCPGSLQYDLVLRDLITSCPSSQHRPPHSLHFLFAPLSSPCTARRVDPFFKADLRARPLEAAAGGS